MEAHITLVLALIIILGITAQWMAWRLQLPAIILLSLFGLLAGPVFGWIQPSTDLGHLLHPVIKLGVAVILFEGGLSLRLHELKEAATGVRRLVTLAVVFIFVLGSAAAHYIGGLAWPVAMVFGAITTVTGPTVIIPLLRQAKLRRRPASYLKWEGIVNDPTGALLAVLTFQYFMFARDQGMGELLWHMGTGLVIAVLLGGGGAWLLAWLFRRGAVAEYLKGPVALASALTVYVLANATFEEAGLLAATIMGVVLGNLRLPSIAEMRRFKEYLVILLVSSVFILLTADLDPAIMLHLDWRAGLLLLTVLLLVRPLGVLAATVGAGMSWQERSLVAWIAPRGIVAVAVAGVFAPQLAAQDYAGAHMLLPLVFALVFSTVVLHGLSLRPLAQYLDLCAKGPTGVLIIGSNSWTVGLAQVLLQREVPVIINDSSWHRLRRARLAGIPTHYGEILSETGEESLELNEVGHLLAATDNSAYNTLVCSQFAGELGRNRVFQLPAETDSGNESRQIQRGMRGLIAPTAEAHYEMLLENWYRGWSFHKTQLSEAFNMAQYAEIFPAESLIVALIAENGQIQFNSSEQPLNPKNGDILIGYGPGPKPVNLPSGTSE
jgi:NhaP-type Na+/H+ or K+/H+ antiporter